MTKQMPHSVQGSQIRFVLGCMIPRAGAVARSRNLGQALFGSPVHNFSAIETMYYLETTISQSIDSGDGAGQGYCGSVRCVPGLPEGLVRRVLSLQAGPLRGLHQQILQRGGLFC